MKEKNYYKEKILLTVQFSKESINILMFQGFYICYKINMIRENSYAKDI